MDAVAEEALTDESAPVAGPPRGPPLNEGVRVWVGVN